MQNKIIIYFICSYLWLELINIVSGVSTISSRVVTKLLVWVEVICCKSSVKFKKKIQSKKIFQPTEKSQNLLDTSSIYPWSKADCLRTFKKT